MKEKYLISGDGSGKTYGIYEVKKGEILPPSDREPIVKGIGSFKEAQKIVAKYELIK